MKKAKDKNSEVGNGLTVDDVYDSVWKSVLEKDGRIDPEILKPLLFDLYLMRQSVPDVYSRITGGRVAASTATADEVLSAVDSEFNSLVDEEIRRRVDSGLLLEVESEDLDFY